MAQISKGQYTAVGGKNQIAQRVGLLLSRRENSDEVEVKKVATDIRIPDGHLDATIVHFDGFDLEVDANGWLHRLEDIVGEAEQNA